MSNFALQDSQKVSYAISEADAKGNVVPPGAGDTVAVTSDSPSSLTVVADAAVDPAKLPTGAVAKNYLGTGFLVGGTAPKVGVQVTATISHTDGSPAPAPVVDLIDIIVGAAVTGAISLGTPVNQ
jgi:hypothetical protein